MSKRCASPVNSSQSDEDNQSAEKISLPNKRYYRQRAHCNPWSDYSFNYPIKPSEMNWDKLFGCDNQSSDNHNELCNFQVQYVDIGCGYGGLLFELATLFPHIRSVGFELRLKVYDFVQEKLHALRMKFPDQYNNIACIRTNAMKFLPNYFFKGQLKKMFFLYPDPHFKRVKHKWRIISPGLLDIYAYLLSPDGRLYTATDVPELASYMANCLIKHPLFSPIWFINFKPKSLDPEISSDLLELNSKSESFQLEEFVVKDEKTLDEIIQSDPIIGLLRKGCTEESHKATREGRGTCVLVFKRIPNPV